MAVGGLEMGQGLYARMQADVPLSHYACEHVL